MAEAGSFADRVKQQADIVRVIGEYVRLKKSGQNFTGLCPFHGEKTPSFAVHPVKQIFHCFGCGKGGDVFSFVMEMEKCPFPDAVKVVAEKDGPILGVHLVGPWASELLAEAYLAVNWEALPSEVGAFIHPHPSLSEAIGETMITFTGRSLHG